MGTCGDLSRQLRSRLRGRHPERTALSPPDVGSTAVHPGTRRRVLLPRCSGAQGRSEGAAPSSPRPVPHEAPLSPITRRRTSQPHGNLHAARSGSSDTPPVTRAGPLASAVNLPTQRSVSSGTPRRGLAVDGGARCGGRAPAHPAFVLRLRPTGKLVFTRGLVNT